MKRTPDENLKAQPYTQKGVRDGDVHGRLGGDI